MAKGHNIENSTKNSRCTTWCWLIAAAVGILVALLLWTTRDWGFIQGAFLGLLIFIIGGALLSWMLCKPQAQVTSASATTSTASNAAATVSTSTGTEAVAGGAIAAAGVAEVASSASADVKPSSELAGSKELAGRKGEWKYEKPEVEAAKPASTKIAPSKTAKPKAAAEAKAPAKKAKTAAKASSAPTAKVASGSASATAKAAAAKNSTSTRAPVAADGKPSTMSKARDGGADDLKLLKGVGPALEKTLNELGFYHFDQVAAWRKKEIDWVDGNLRFKGRIERDEWIKQAKVLAKGGTTAFVTKAKKG